MMADKTKRTEDEQSLADLTVAGASERIQEANPADLTALEQEERAGQARPGVLHALQVRRETLAEGENLYSPDDMAGWAVQQGYSPYLVHGAFAAAGVTGLPLDAAQDLIHAFAKREV